MCSAQTCTENKTYENTKRTQIIWKCAQWIICYVCPIRYWINKQTQRNTCQQQQRHIFLAFGSFHLISSNTFNYSLTGRCFKRSFVSIPRNRTYVFLKFTQTIRFFHWINLLKIIECWESKCLLLLDLVNFIYKERYDY